MKQLNRGCELVMTTLISTKQSGSDDRLSIDQIPIDMEFADIFKEEITGLPPKRG